MKTLTILRHAKSSWRETGQRDFDRALNERGFSDIAFMPDRLLQKVGVPDFILSSSANRAQTTAHGFANKFQLKVQLEEGMYHADADSLLSHIAKVDTSVDHILIVAHNPGLTYLVNRLAQDFDIDNLPTCAFVSLGFDVDNWSDLNAREGKCLAYDFPKS